MTSEDEMTSDAVSMWPYPPELDYVGKGCLTRVAYTGSLGLGHRPGAAGS